MTENGTPYTGRTMTNTDITHLTETLGTDTTHPSRKGPRGAAPTRRRSRQRDLLGAYLAEQNGFRSAQQIHGDLRTRGDRVGLATVYRALQAMVDDGEVDVLRGADGEQSFRRCTTTGHHHHLICRNCGLTVELEDPPVERWVHDVARRHGFSDVDHHVEISGHCADCSAMVAPGR